MCSDPAPLDPPYPYGPVGQSIPLHLGQVVVDGAAHDGQVEFRLMPDSEVSWRLESPSRPRPKLGRVAFELRAAGGSVTVEGECSSSGLTDSSGYLHACELPADNVHLERILVHWLNLPAVRAPGLLHDPQTRTTYAGRWTARLADWVVTMDRRSDHREVWTQARDLGSRVTTHVMEIRRVDDALFLPEEITPVLDALHLGVSFALGRWVAPALPVGFDDADRQVWQQWGARLCTAGAPGALRWWFEQREWELAELLDLVVHRSAVSDDRFSLRFLLSSAVHSAAGGFVEQRVTSAFAALEHLMWIRLAARGGMSKTAYKRLHAHERLSMLLDEAQIDPDIDRKQLPALHAAADRRPADVPRTGPAIVCHVRNLIVHPTDHEEELYRQETELVRQAWFLTHHYLVLLILHHVGYTGCYQRQLPPGGWAGDVHRVPWAS